VTSPSGARIRVDGVVVDEPSPTTVYVLKGKHNISVELDGWNDQKDFDSKGTGTERIELIKPDAPPPPKTEAAKPVTPPAAKPETPKPIEPSGIMGGLALSLYGYTFVNKEDDAEEKPTGFVFGLEAEVGYALSPNIAALLRVFAGLGSKEGSAATIGAGGPVASFRVADDLWLGAGIIFGASQADATAQREGEVTAETDTAFGPTGEISYAFSNDSTGQWLISILPGMLITTTEEQSTIFVPLVIGHRWF
jgi:hypothetical protein